MKYLKLLGSNQHSIINLDQVKAFQVEIDENNEYKKLRIHFVVSGSEGELRELQVKNPDKDLVAKIIDLAES